MWPFRKKRKIKPVFKNIWFDFYTTDGENKFQLDQKLLYDVLDKEQVEYLNSLAPVQKEYKPAAEIFAEMEEYLTGYEKHALAEKKRNPVTDEQRLEKADCYRQYLENNKDKAILSKEEEQKLLRALKINK